MEQEAQKQERQRIREKERPAIGTNHDWKNGVCIGQALRPGPSIPLVLQELIPAAMRKGKQGSGQLARFNAARRVAAKTVWEEALIVSTANGTTWTSLKEYVKHALGHVLCLQEHHLLQHQVDAASQWCAMNGYKSIWAAATPTPGDKGTSGGVATHVRDELGITEEMRPKAAPHGGLLCKVDASGF